MGIKFEVAMIVASIAACSGLFYFKATAVDWRGDYLAGRMAEVGCVKSAPCNFLADSGPEVYRCDNSESDRSTLPGENGTYYGPIDFGSERSKYLIYDERGGKTGEPDTRGNRDDFFPPFADPGMIALQQRGEDLGCREVREDLIFEKKSRGDDWMNGGIPRSPQYGCLISTCEAWVEKGEIVVRKKRNLPDGA